MFVIPISLSFFRETSADIVHNLRGRSTVALFILHGAKVAILDRQDPIDPLPEGAVLFKGSVMCAFVYVVYHFFRSFSYLVYPPVSKKTGKEPSAWPKKHLVKL